MADYTMFSIYTMRIILSLIAIVIGVIITLKADWIILNFGAVEFGERYLGSSRLFWKLVGTAIIIIATFTMIGVTQALLRGFFGILIHR